jgi:hypothetical protein
MNAVLGISISASGLGGMLGMAIAIYIVLAATTLARRCSMQ